MTQKRKRQQEGVLRESSGSSASSCLSMRSTFSTIRRGDGTGSSYRILAMRLFLKLIFGFSYGYAKTGANSAGESYLLKTTTGGDNWTIARLNSNSGSSADEISEQRFRNNSSKSDRAFCLRPVQNNRRRTWDSLRR